MHLTRAFRSGAMLLLVWLGCASPGEQAAIHLDRVAESLDAYGFASISSPFLATPTTEFGFDLNRKASDYYAEAFTPQGAVRHFSAEALDVQLAFRMNLEQALATIAQYNRARSISAVREAQRKAAVQKQMLETLVQHHPQTAESPLVKSVSGMLGVIQDQPEPNPEALPGFEPAQKDIELGSLFPVDDRLARQTVGPFSDGLGFPQNAFKISARDALLIASGDSMTQSLFRWFTNPAGHKLDDYELFFCPVIVSVQPGYKTREGFLADVTVNVDLARDGENGLEYVSDGYPQSSPPLQVAGVFPVIDSQVLDLVNSRRQLFSLAMQLSLMGFGAQADAFADYAKRLEQDAKTASTITVGSAYTIGSTSFGVRVEPKLVASRDPTRLQTEPGRILDSKTFPAMAVLLVHRSLMKPAQDRWDDAHAAGEYCRPQQADGAVGEATCKGAGYDYLVFRTSTRWAPLRRGWLGGDRYSEVEAWRRAKALDEYAGQGGNFSSREREQLRLREINLRKLALDTQAIVKIGHSAPKSEVIVESVLPDRGWLDQYTVLTIRGSGFKGNVSVVTVGGIACTPYVQDDHTLLVVVPPWAAAKKDAAKPARELPEFFATVVARPAVAAATDGPPRAIEAHVAQTTATRAADAAELSNKWAQVVIAASVPVMAGCRQERFPDSAPPGDGAERFTAPVGWVLFDKVLPGSCKPPGPQPNAGITVRRDSCGNITGIDTQGPFENAAAILERVREALRCGSDLELQVHACGRLHPGSPCGRDCAKPPAKPQPDTGEKHGQEE